MPTKIESAAENDGLDLRASSLRWIEPTIEVQHAASDALHFNCDASTVVVSVSTMT